MKGRAHPTETFKTFLRPPLRVFHFQRCAPQAPRRNPVVVVVYDGRGRWGVVTVVVVVVVASLHHHSNQL